MQHAKGLFGMLLTAASTATAWANAVELGFRIGAGVIGCVAGYWTARYYRQKWLDRKAERAERKAQHEIDKASAEAKLCFGCHGGKVPPICPVNPRPANCRQVFMKKTSLIIGLAFGLALLTTACNTTKFSRTQVADGKTNTTQLVNYRFLWSNEGYVMTINTNLASITCQKTSVDSAAIGAAVQGAVQGAMLAK